jgi:predicted dehydrogenase
MPVKYRVAVIGRTGQGNYGHGLDTVWLKTDRAEVVAVADPDEAGRLAAQKRLAARTAYADYREMLARERPQIVSVASRWPEQNRDIVLACAERGANVFLEKPVAPTLREADEMVAACERFHVKCAVAHQTRYSLRVKVVKDLIAAGRIGDVLELRGRGKEDARGGGEDLMVLGTHTFDLMRHLAGDAVWCFARVQQAGRPAGPGDVRRPGEPIGPIQGDAITAQYGLGGSAVGSFATHKAKPDGGAGGRYWLEVRGTKGMLQVGYGVFGPTYLCEDPTWMTGKSRAAWQEVTSQGLGRPETLTPREVDNGNVLIVHDLMEAIERDRPPLGSLHDGRAALEMVLAVYESHRLGRPVDLPLRNRRHPLTPA